MKRYKDYFSQQRVLIVDDSSASRISIARGLTELGAISTTLSIAESYEAAQSLIASNSGPKKFTVVICELDLGTRSGLDLIQAVKSRNEISISAIITKNQTDVASALAAENDIDVFLRKPFSMELFKKSIETAIRSRLNLRNPHQDAFGALDSAIEILQKSQTTKRIYDKFGYRALVQLFESLLSEAKKPDAYAVLRRLVTTYPVHPDRLSMAMRLAIETRNFDDVDAYYQLFLEMDLKGQDLIRHAYAALVSSAKAALSEGNLEKAMSRFKQASLTSGKRAGVLNEIILALVEFGHLKEADSFLASYPQHERQAAEFLAIDYRVMSKLQPLHLVLQRGRELIKNRQASPMVYEILIDACKKAGHQAEAESLALDAGRHWPSAKEDPFVSESTPAELPSA